MLILKKNIQYRLWFDVDLRLVTTRLHKAVFCRGLWFDVDLRLVTTPVFSAILVGLLWFDVDLRLVTTAHKAYAALQVVV